MKKRLSIIMPVYNALEYVNKTLLSLKENTDNDYELIIVDDNSGQKTKNFLKTIDCLLITNPENYMVNKSWNIGIKAATGDYVCVINSDILFTPGWDTKLIKALSNDVWVASPYYTVGDVPFIGKPKRTRKIDVLGSCFLFKNGLMDTIGFFPDKLKLWYGDNWLSDIIKEKYHKKTLQVKDDVIHHFRSRSTLPLSFQKIGKVIASDWVEYNKIRVGR